MFYLVCGILPDLPSSARNPANLSHTDYSGDYAEVMPHLIEAHQILIPDFIAAYVPEPFGSEVADIVLSLCHPDPSRRGHRKNVSGMDQFGLERFITQFDFLASRASISGRRSN